MAKWKRIDRPTGAHFLDDGGNCSARVRPVGGGWEWSIWSGPAGRRVLDDSGETRTVAGAKKAAERKLRRCAR